MFVVPNVFNFTEKWVDTGTLGLSTLVHLTLLYSSIHLSFLIKKLTYLQVCSPLQKDSVGYHDGGCGWLHSPTGGETGEEDKDSGTCGWKAQVKSKFVLMCCPEQLQQNFCSLLAMAMIALLSVQSSAHIYWQCYFVHWHLQQCLIQLTSLADRDAILVNNCWWCTINFPFLMMFDLLVVKTVLHRICFNTRVMRGDQIKISRKFQLPRSIWTDGVFPLPDSESYADSYSDADGYCTQFDTNISTDRWVFKVIFLVHLHRNDHPNQSQ